MKHLFHAPPEACELSLELPMPFERVIVIGKGYRTVGYVDEQHVWRQYFDDSVMNDVVDWYSLK